MDQPSQITAIPAPPPPVSTRPPSSGGRRSRALAGALALFVIASWTVALRAVDAERHSIDELSGATARAHRAEEVLAARLDALSAAEDSLATRVGGFLDPTSIVLRSQGSVFTLMAGAWQGSAFVISSDARTSVLVTNYHVVRTSWTAGVRNVVVRNGDASFNGSIVRVRPDVDLAIVEVHRMLPALEAAAGTPDVGQPVVVVGSPYGYGGTISTGVVSAIRDRYVQFSAPVSPGSSGGPVLDASGQVIGVAAAKVEGPGAEGLSFAIPIWRVCQMTVAC